MTPTDKLVKAIRMALRRANIDGLEGMTGATIIVNYKRPGAAEVEVKPTIAGSFDLTEAFA